MVRNKGQFQFAANFEVKAAEALDPRIVVEKKSELINKETWPYDGDTIYLYKGILVSVQEEEAVYMLVDTSKILNSDYSGWEKLGTDNTNQIEIVDNLTSNATDKALSAKQGKVLKGEIDNIKHKIVNIYTFKGTVDDYESLLLKTDAQVGDVYNVDAAYGELGEEGYVPAGTNYAYTSEGTWDALGGTIDLSDIINRIEDLEESGTGGGNSGENNTLSQQVNANTLAISTLKGNETIEGSVDYKIKQAFNSEDFVVLVDANDEVDDPILEYVTLEDLNTAIATAITTVLNTEV